MIFTKLSYLNKLDNFSFSEKDKERVNNDMKTLTVQLIIESVKDQRKNLFENSKYDSDNESNGHKDYDHQDLNTIQDHLLNKYESLERKQNWEK